jgi:hypothetical protein
MMLGIFSSVFFLVATGKKWVDGQVETLNSPTKPLNPSSPSA